MFTIETSQDIDLVDRTSTEQLTLDLAHPVIAHSSEAIFDSVHELPIDPAIKDMVAQVGSDDWRVREGLRQVAEFDDTTFRHVVRVGALSTHLAFQSGLNGEETQPLVMGAMLHDLGKVRVPKNIIQKDGALSDEERAAIKAHPEAGYRMARSLFRGEPNGTLKRLVPQLVLTHHCHNASAPNYPDAAALDGLEQEGVLMVTDLDDPILQELGRILAVSDVYEAITADRTYTAGRGFENPLRVRKVLEESHPDMERSIGELMSLHARRFPPYGFMPTVALSERS